MKTHSAAQAKQVFSVLIETIKTNSNLSQKDICDRLGWPKQRCSNLLREEKEGKKVSNQIIEKIKVEFALELQADLTIRMSIQDILGKLTAQVIRLEVTVQIMAKYMALRNAFDELSYEMNERAMKAEIEAESIHRLSELR